MERENLKHRLVEVVGRKVDDHASDLGSDFGAEHLLDVLVDSRANVLSPGLKVGRLEIILHEHSLDLFGVGLSEYSFLSYRLRLNDLSGWRHLLSNREGELLRCLRVTLISRGDLVVLLVNSLLLVVHLVGVLLSLLIIGPTLVSPLTIILSTTIVTIVLVTIGSSSLVIGSRVTITTVVVVGVGPLGSTIETLVTTDSVVTQIK